MTTLYRTGARPPSPTTIPRTAAEAVRFAGLAARATLLRCCLRRRGGQYELVRTAWGLSRQCESLDDVARVLRLIGGSQ